MVLTHHALRIINSNKYQGTTWKAEGLTHE
jgi:hypothetical protein